MKKENLKGVDGWLILLIFGLLVGSPILTIATFSEAGDYSLYAILDVVGMVGLFILAGVFLIMKTYYAVKFAKILFITMIILNIFLMFLEVVEFNFYYMLLTPLVWTLYLYNSERVKQTYGDIPEKKEGYQIWPILAIIYAVLSSILGAVFSIVALIRIYKNRKLKGLTLSIIALILSIVLFLSWTFLFALIDYESEFNAPLEVSQEVENRCTNKCYLYLESNPLASIDKYMIEYDAENEVFVCKCLDVDDSVVFSSNIDDV